MDYNNEPPKIVFGGEQFQRPQSFQTPTPKIVQWVIKYSGGLVKDEKQANYVLIGFVAVAIIISLFLFFGGGSSSYNEKIIPPMPAAEWRS
ncbi:MAG: hypothetical protein O2794_04290 [bacterium]|nr:hypothetical protein [bacterium]